MALKWGQMRAELMFSVTDLEDLGEINTGHSQDMSNHPRDRCLYCVSKLLGISSRSQRRPQAQKHDRPN